MLHRIKIKQVIELTEGGAEYRIYCVFGQPSLVSYCPVGLLTSISTRENAGEHAIMGAACSMCRDIRTDRRNRRSQNKDPKYESTVLKEGTLVESWSGEYQTLHTEQWNKRSTVYYYLRIHGLLSFQMSRYCIQYLFKLLAVSLYLAIEWCAGFWQWCWQGQFWCWQLPLWSWNVATRWNPTYTSSF